MSTIQPRRVTKSLSPEEQSRLKELRQKVAGELPDLVARDQLRKEARPRVNRKWVFAAGNPS